MSLGKDMQIKMSKVKEVRLRSEIPGEHIPEPAMKKQKCEADQASPGLCVKRPVTTVLPAKERSLGHRASSSAVMVDQ